MTDHPVDSVYIDGQDVAKGDVRGYLQARAPLVLTNADEITAMDAGQARDIQTGGRVFEFDPLDTTSPQDGITTLVDATGRRFKTADILAPRAAYFAVLSRTLTVPPASPQPGDQYIVGPAATGAWATHDDEVATASGGIWNFTAPRPGDLAFVLSEPAIYHRNAAGSAWVAGVPGALVAGSVTIAKLLMGISVKVEGTANDVGGTPANGTAYIVGAAPTGNFAGFGPNNLAVRESGQWVQYVPTPGDRIDDRSSGAFLRFTGTTWSGGDQAVALRQRRLTRTEGVNVPSFGQNQIYDQAITLTNAANRVQLRVTVEALSVATTVSLQFKKDGGATVLKTVAFSTLGTVWMYDDGPGDAVQHTYQIEAFADAITALTFYAELEEAELLT